MGETDEATLPFAVLAAAFAAPAAAQTILKVHSFSSPQAPDQALHLFPWAEKVNKASGGKLKVEVYPSMQLGGKPADLPQQLEDGVVDAIFHLPGFSPGRFPGDGGHRAAVHQRRRVGRAEPGGVRVGRTAG